MYEGPPFAFMPVLMDELMADVRSAPPDLPVYVRAAMAHLNLVMIHPFRDGNGRMARCLQTLVLSRDQVAAPVFSSIEEFLGHNTEGYYTVLAVTADGQLQPSRDTTAWVRFNLRAHHIQAQTVPARNGETAALWNGVEALVNSEGLPERSVPAVFDAAYGLRLRRSNYERSTGVEPKRATRDLSALVSAGLLLAEGEKRGRPSCNRTSTPAVGLHNRRLSGTGGALPSTSSGSSQTKSDCRWRASTSSLAGVAGPSLPHRLPQLGPERRNRNLSP